MQGQQSRFRLMLDPPTMRRVPMLLRQAGRTVGVCT
jgi:hypothetical protein